VELQQMITKQDPKLIAKLRQVNKEMKQTMDEYDETFNPLTTYTGCLHEDVHFVKETEIEIDQTQKQTSQHSLKNSEFVPSDYTDFDVPTSVFEKGDERFMVFTRAAYGILDEFGKFNPETKGNGNNYMPCVILLYVELGLKKLVKQLYKKKVENEDGTVTVEDAYYEKWEICEEPKFHYKKVRNAFIGDEGIEKKKYVMNVYGRVCVLSEEEKKSVVNALVGETNTDGVVVPRKFGPRFYVNITTNFGHCDHIHIEVHPTDKTNDNIPYEVVINNNDPIRLSHRVIGSDGKRNFILANGKVLNYTGQEFISYATCKDLLDFYETELGAQYKPTKQDAPEDAELTEIPDKPQFRYYDQETIRKIAEKAKKLGENLQAFANHLISGLAEGDKKQQMEFEVSEEDLMKFNIDIKVLQGDIDPEQFANS
jgi:hypothetical protein